MSTYGKNTIIKFLEIIICLMLCVIFATSIFASNYRIKRYNKFVIKSANAFNVRQELILAVIKVESNFHEKAKSDKGAYGLMQIKKSTFNYVCNIYSLDYTEDDIFKPEANICVGTAYLDYLYGKFKYDVVVLAAYNAGEGNVRLWLSDSAFSTDGKTLMKIPFKETEMYVNKILRYTKYFEDNKNENSSSTRYVGNAYVFG